MERRPRACTIFAVMAVTYCFSQFYRMSTAVTAVNFFLMAGPAPLQQTIGIILDQRPGDYRAAFGAVALSLLLGAGAYLVARDTHPSRIRRE